MATVHARSHFGALSFITVCCKMRTAGTLGLRLMALVASVACYVSASSTCDLVSHAIGDVLEDIGG